MEPGSREKDFFPCYFFYGEETFLARQFVQQLRDSFFSPDADASNVESFGLDETSWAEIIDLARTIPIFFAPCRLIIVEIAETQKTIFSAKDKSIVGDYLASPSQKSILVIVYQGKLKKSAALYSFFSSFPSQTVAVKEVKPLKERSLTMWMDRMMSSLGKNATMEAKMRLEEVNGNNLSLLSSEIEKLAAFVGERETIELDDVNQVSGWAKTSAIYELTNSLEECDYKKGLLVLQEQFREGIRPERIFAIFSNFFRDMFLAKVWLREKHADRKAVFKKLRPQISERFGGFYRTKLNDFFAIVDSLPQKELDRYLQELEGIDLSIKTSATSAQTHLERFLYDYCSTQKKRLFGRGSRE
jgi:DNA polymerase III delta subunit